MVTLGEVVERVGGSIKTGPFGTVLKAAEYTPSGVPLISTGEVGYGRFKVEAKTPRVGPTTVARLADYLLEEGDVVFARKGGIDRSAWVSAAESGWFLGSDGLRLRLGHGVDSRFIAYQLQGEKARRWLVQHAGGTTMPSLNQRILAELPLTLAPLDEQRRIAGVLGAFDDLIETDRALVARLESVWRYVVTLAAGCSQAEAPLSKLAKFANGRNFTRGASGTGMPVIRTPEVRTGPGPTTVRSDIAAHADNIANFGDILFVWSGSLLVDRWVWEPGLVNQHIFKVLPEESTPPWLVLWAIESLMVDFLGVAADKATTMGHIKRADLERTVKIPAQHTWNELDSVVSTIYESASELQVEIRDLTRRRDELLPLLMSGKICVSDSYEVT